MFFFAAVVPTQPLEPEPDNTGLVVGVAIGGGAGLLLLILCIGTLGICLLCFKKKKNYKKYVLPYRTYMDGKSILHDGPLHKLGLGRSNITCVNYEIVISLLLHCS